MNPLKVESTVVSTAPPRRSSQSPHGSERSDRVLAVPTVLMVVGLHVLLGIGGALSPHVATLHAALTIVFSLGVMFFTSRPDLVIAVAVYGGVCDVYWRMTDSRAPWELSKYLLTLGALVLLARFVRHFSSWLIPTAFLLVLVPGMLFTAFAEDLWFARDQISGVTMGVVAFGLAALAFRQVVADQADAWNLGWIILGPLIATLSVVTFSILTHPDIDFSDESNSIASGGFGPNQVSAALGLTILVCILMAFLTWARRLWPVLAGISAWALWAAFLTFSRGGLYSLVLAGGAMLLVSASTRGARVRSIITLVVVAVTLVVIFSVANDFTGNALRTRYEDAGTTGRSTIAELDVQVFYAHPLLGVGVGRAAEFRGSGHLATNSAHTEYTRLLAEHGVLGVAAIGLLITMVVQAYRRSMCRWNRLTVVALSVWSLTIMLHAATRIGAVSVVLALAQIRVEERRAEYPLGPPRPSSGQTRASGPGTGQVLTGDVPTPREQGSAPVPGRSGS